MSFLNRLTALRQAQQPRMLATWELVLLGIVWLLLSLAFLTADYQSSDKLKRYELELSSYTANVYQPQLLKEVCGKDFLIKVAKHKKDKNYQFSKDCPAVNEQSYAQILNKGTAHLIGVQQALTTTWQQEKFEKRRIDLLKNETEIHLASDGLLSRQDWLNLNDKGQLDSIKQLLTITTKATNQQNQSNQQVSINHDLSIDTSNINKLDLTIALLAVADGNRRFPFTSQFINQPDLAKLLNKTTSNVAKIYDTNRNHTKAENAKNLLPFFGSLTHLGMLTQVFIWSMVTWFMLTLSRQNRHPLLLLPIGLTAWGLVIALISHGAIFSMKVGLMIFCLGMLLTAAVLFLPSQKIFEQFPDNREQISSPWLYPLFVAFTTFGLLILFDLSGRSYFSLRYLFLSHFQDLFWCYVIISFSRIISQVVAGGIKWLVANNLLHAIWGNTATQSKKARILLGVMTVGFLALAIILRGDSAKIAEISKIWLISFLAVFLAINQRALINNLFFHSKKMTFLLIFALLIPVISLAISNEKGTILVMLFMLTFMVGVALSNRIFQMGGRGYITGVLSSTAILLVLMMVLVNVSGFDDRTAERVSTWMNPFASTNDQMAILHWFRESAPFLGFGLGDVPWCGYHLSGCRGVPLQMQSDYTITSVMAVLGIWASVIVLAIYFAWLLLMAIKQLAFANEQTKSHLLSSSYLLLSWMILVWIVITIFQAIVTISGNLGMLPLTGVTLPFLSYGSSSLWFNSFMFALALFQPKLVIQPALTYTNQQSNQTTVENNQAGDGV